MPILLGIAAARYSLGEAEVGYLSSAYFGGYVLSTVSSVLWVRRFNWRHIAFVGTILMVLGLFLPVLVSNYVAMFVGLIIAGLGAGIIFAESMCITSDMADPDRKFAIKISIESAYGALVLFTLPVLILETYGANAFYLAYVVVIIAVGLLGIGLPRGNKARLPMQSGNRSSRRADLLSIAGLFCLFLSFGSVVSVYVFFERIGQDVGLTIGQVGQFVAISALTGIFGPLMAAYLGDRIGRVWPQVIGTVIVVIAYILLSVDPTPLRYGVAVALIPFGLYFALAYQNGIVASADESGRYSSLMAASLAIGAVIGPLIAGSIIEAYGYTQLYTLSAIVLAAAVIGFSFISAMLNTNAEQRQTADMPG